MLVRVEMRIKVGKRFDRKYIRFFVILAFTGICFFNREPLLFLVKRIFAWGIENYEQAFRVNEHIEEDTVSGDVSGSDSISGNSVSGNAGEEDLSGGDAGYIPWKYVTADETYFDDAVFIGDSRTVGLSEYAGLDNTTFYASTGLTVYKLFDAEIIAVDGSLQKKTIEEALTEKQFSKIYLMIGINEMGTGTVDTFMEKYRAVLVHLQELQPDAIIYVQAIMRVTGDRSAQGDYINNEGIDARNAEIEKLADNQKVFYLDVNPLICDEEGGLISSYTFDGVHLKAQYISIWKQFLLEHAVVFSEE